MVLRKGFFVKRFDSSTFSAISFLCTFLQLLQSTFSNRSHFLCETWKQRFFSSFRHPFLMCNGFQNQFFIAFGKDNLVNLLPLLVSGCFCASNMRVSSLRGSMSFSVSLVRTLIAPPANITVMYNLTKSLGNCSHICWSKCRP